MSSDEYSNFVHHHKYAVSKECKRRKMDSTSSIVEVVSSPPPIDERISPAGEAMSSAVSSLNVAVSLDSVPINANILNAVVEESPGALLQSNLSEMTMAGEVNSNNSSKVKEIRPDKRKPASSFVSLSSDKCANFVHDHRYAVSQNCEKRKTDSTSFMDEQISNASSSPDIPVSPTLHFVPIDANILKEVVEESPGALLSKKNSSSNVATKLVHPEPTDIQSPTQGANITFSSKRNEEKFADLSPMETKSKVQLLEERHEDVRLTNLSFHCNKLRLTMNHFTLGVIIGYIRGRKRYRSGEIAKNLPFESYE